MNWQSADTAPRDGSTFLAWYADGSYRIVCYVSDERDEAAGFTHWCVVNGPVESGL